MRNLGLAILACLLLAGCGADVALDGLADGGRARLTAVEAGGLLVLEDGRKITLAGLIMPATGEPHASQSMRTLRDLAKGREVRILRGGAAEGPFHVRDAQNRDWLQLRLLEDGVARVRTAFNDRALAPEMLRAEDRARRAGRGLWALPAYQVRLPGEVVAARADGFVIVEGRVVRAANAAERLYLEFGGEWRGGLSTETPLSALTRFDDAGLELRALEGRLVRVRGEVRPTAFGPRLRLDHPEQVERLREPAG